MLAAMVDILINLLLFLLQLYGNSPAFLQPGKDLEFARSASEEPVAYGPNVRVSRAGVEVDGELLARFGPEGAAPAASELDAVRDALQRRLPPEADPEDPPELVVQADRTLAWSQLSPVLSAAGEAGFGDLRFVVTTEREER
jgi:biopolymer transport protein ExbD